MNENEQTLTKSVIYKRKVYIYKIRENAWTYIYVCANVYGKNVFKYEFYFKKNFLCQVFLVRKKTGPDAGQLYAMKVLKKASLKGRKLQSLLKQNLIMLVLRNVLCIACIS